MFPEIWQNDPNVPYPVVIKPSGYLLSVDEAERLVEELEDTLREIKERTRRYVQVVYPGGSFRYTYADPSGALKVGDLVFAPTRRNDEQIATVVALGRGRLPEGREPRPITAKLTVEEIAA